MKTHQLLPTVAALFALALVPSSVRAAAIFGEISFNGGGVELLNSTGNPVTIASSDPVTAITFLSNPPLDVPKVVVDDTYGDYSVAIGETVNFNIPTLDFAGVSSGSLLWQAGDFEFYVDSVTSEENLGTLYVRGKGIVKAPTFDDTPGTWVLTTQGTQSTMTWSSSLKTVPDGGTTLALLGASLAGLFGVRRFLAR